MNEKWTIGEVAKLFDVSTDTLRFYEKVGILSSHKNGANGYRYYSYDEIVVLMDILFFRNMELSVKDIKQIITKMDVGDIKNILYQNQRIVEDRIHELIKLRKMIGQVASHYEVCEQRLGEFAIVPAPDFKYKVLDKQADDLVDMIRKYKKEDWGWMDSIRYTLFVPQEELLKSLSFSSARVGISLDEENLYRLDSSEQQELSSLNEAEYLYTIVGTSYSEEDHDALSKALDYLKEAGRQVKGPLLGRYMASSHKDGLDYYEVWIAVNTS
jgi:DNA-binding transcriptional MerR regulator